MIYPENRYEFTINEVSKACDMSRTTLIRLEESGFLTPYRVDPESGYRYYDANNIAQIGQYQLLQKLGLSKKEITDFYYGRIEPASFISTQREKLNRLQRLLNELEIRYAPSSDYLFSYIDLPELTCYCETIQVTNMSMAETVAYDMHQTLTKKGFQPKGTEPIFAIFQSPLNTEDISSFPLGAQLCFPILPSQKEDSHIRTIPGCYAFSVIGHGDYSVIPDLFKRFGEEIVARQLKPAGPPRIISLVAPYVGGHIAPEHFCHELILPIEKESN